MAMNWMGSYRRNFVQLLLGILLLIRLARSILILSGSIRGRTFVGKVFATCLHYLTIDSISAQR